KEFPIKSTWRLIWLKNKKFSPAASAFLHYLEKEKEDIIKQTFGWYELY
ncbi:LysR family transcriptional regulator, partial [Marivirga lumbricoides]